MIIPFSGKNPVTDESCFIADNATIAGEVTLEENVSVWFGAALRGDMASISVGKGSNIQENAVVHVSPGHPAVIGKNVTVGHGAIVHGATIGDNVLVGMSAVVLDGATIGKNSIIGAGAVVTSGTAVPENTLMLGVPAVAAKKLVTSAASNSLNASAYVKLGKKYKEELEEKP